MGQGGNVWEWMETAYDGINSNVGEGRDLRGDSFTSTSKISASVRSLSNPSGETIEFGFRVASVPEPSALSLLAIGLGILFRRSRKRD
jgi:formylglycine-generating enzyme required for sulfatase activity